MRSKWKNIYFDIDLYNEIVNDSKLNKSKKSMGYNKSYYFTHNKSSYILPVFLHKLIYVYNGKKYILLNITKGMIGHKSGDFIYTKKRCVYKVKKGKKKK